MTIKTGVIGHPISHSKSPLIHGYWIKTYFCKGTYEAIDIAPENLKSGIDDLIAQGFAGFNVTVPHKQAIMEYCDTLDDTALAVGAVNTVVIENGRLEGRNTDVFGFIENIRSAERNMGLSWGLENGPALVLGAGGAARAAVYGLIRAGVPKIYIANRTLEKAQELCDFAPGLIEALPWDQKESVLPEINFLANTTALGMIGKDALEIDLSSTHPDALVHDIVYAPLYTDLLRAARDHDLRVLTGIGMLLHQARPAFEAWFDIMPLVTPALEDLVLV